MTYVANTSQLTHLLTEATKNDWNHSFLLVDLPDFIESLDPDGFHVISPIIVHEHKAGQLTEPHLRCFVYVKFAGKDADPSDKMLLDMPMSLTDMLHKVDVDV